MRPRFDVAGQALKPRRYIGRTEATIKNEVKSAKVDDDRFVPMATAGMLRGIRIDSQLVDLPEEHRIVKLLAEHFGEHLPTFRRGVKVPVIPRGNTPGHG